MSASSTGKDEAPEVFDDVIGDRALFCRQSPQRALSSLLYEALKEERGKVAVPFDLYGAPKNEGSRRDFSFLLGQGEFLRGRCSEIPTQSRGALDRRNDIPH